jgi:micrococcal nuclease
MNRPFAGTRNRSSWNLLLLLGGGMHGGKVRNETKEPRPDHPMGVELATSPRRSRSTRRKRSARAAAHRGCALALAAFAAAPLESRLQACELRPTLHHDALGVSDGQTIELDNGKAIRLAAILPPTAYDSPAAPTNWPLETSTIRALEKLTGSGTLALAPEREAPDRYGRLIAQAFLIPPDGRDQTAAAGSPATAAPPAAAQWLQARLVSQGHARVTLTPEISTQCAEAVLAAEADAEADHLGLWREALYQPKSAGDPRAPLAYRSTFQIVVGTIHAVTSRGRAAYLNFAEDWQRDFTARIRQDALKRAGIPAKALDRLTGRTVRIRGWIERRGGPLITVWRLEQIELLAKDAATSAVRQTPPRLATSLSEEPGTASPEPTPALQKGKAPAPK